jgi:hypothetical protein
MRIKSYGIKTYDINGYVLHTIRIAFRATNENRSIIEEHFKLPDELTEPSSIIFYQNSKNKIVVESVTPDYSLFEKNRLNIMTLCKKIAQSNLDLKYNYLEVYENNTNRIS